MNTSTKQLERNKMTQPFLGNNRTVRINEHTGTTNFFYRDTPVVSIFSDGSIGLNSANFRTATTKRVMNQVAIDQNLGFTVYQKKGEWFVTWRHDIIPFFDFLHLK